jgi:hypothetical protein
MTTATKTMQKPPRFTLSLVQGRIAYTCRGCKQQCPHPKPMMQHLQACRAS